MLRRSVAGACCVLSLAMTWAFQQETTFINLQAHANQKLADNFGSGIPGNNLGELPTGEQTLEGVKFKVEESVIQLRSKLLPKKPETIEGIKVDRPFVKLHILHGTCWGCGKEDDPKFVADGTLIGQYTLHYEDKSAEVIEIAYGQDVRDWWDSDDSKAVTRGKVAWRGDNEVTKRANKKLRLYLTAWTNPKPDKKVATIDYLSTSETGAAPFCVAMTLEGQ